MVIINADDFGRSRTETTAVINCFNRGRITSTTAMVFMEDSERAAECGLASGIDIGLHLNFSQVFTGRVADARLREYQADIVAFMTRNRYALLLYHPGLRKQFHYVYQAQFDEFVRLYSRQPSHVDGHQHRHLCTNMLVDRIIPTGYRIRRSFSFSPGEKGYVNRAYRAMVDRAIARRYKVTDFFFSLDQTLRYDRLGRVLDLARTSVVELMAHPKYPSEFEFLMGDAFGVALSSLELGNYGSL